MSGLEHHYSGDDAWAAAAAAATEQYWTGSPSQLDLLARLGGDADLAAMVVAAVDDTWPVWLQTRVPALEGVRPLDCLDSDHRRRRLRELLLRMP